jgi:hypothetical protein
MFPYSDVPFVFYTFYLVYIWHCRIKLFLRHLPNCPCSNFSRYIDLFQEISPRIAKQLRFQVKLHHLRRKCKNDNPGLFANAMKNPDALRIFSPEFIGGNIHRWKNITAPTEVSDMARNMKSELFTFSLYCISRKTVNTEYMYYSWCMTSTDIVKWRKTNDYENFVKGMIYMKILKKWG